MTISRKPQIKNDSIDDFIKGAKDESMNKKEVKKVTSEEVEKHNNYTIYKSIPVTKAMQGDKYKVNFSLSKEVAQKIQHIQAIEGISMRDYSKIAELAVDLLYDIKYLLGENVMNKKSSELLELLGIDTSNLK
jgi:hypothetical protein